MKSKRLLSVLLALMLMLSVLPAGTPALASTVPSVWAIPEMNNANTAGLLTPNAAKDFHRSLTRVEFCELVVKMSEKVLGKELTLPTSNPFTDTTSIYSQKASQYGVTYGVGDGKFDPDSQIQRQQLCTMMVRAIRNLERDTGRVFLQGGIQTLPFKDNSNIDTYAVDSIKIAYANGIMLGDDTNKFNPKSDITSEQCVATVIRSFDTMQEELSVGKTDQQLVDMAYNRIHIGFAYGDTEDGVTRDIVLPSAGPANTAVTWKSSNENVISSDGTVRPGNSPVTVTLTASIKLGSASSDKVFTLKTSPYSGDRLLLENAYSKLDISYTRNGDGPNSVTGRICLPDNILSLPVTWSTSNSSVISREGYVYVPSSSEVRTVTLTAVISRGSETKTKYFELKVNNPQYTSRSVSLYGVELGMTQSQVAQVLGSYKRSISAGSSETWNLYHDGYKNFVAVAFIGNSSVAVYSSAADVSEQLKDASKTVLTAAQANGFNNVTAISYTDPGSSNREYAIMLYNPASVIGTSRTLYAEGQEQLLFELVNAFRYRNSRAVIEWNSKLGTSARNHSAEMGNYNFLSVTSRDGKSTFKDRAAARDYEEKLVGGGNVLGGANDAVEFFNILVNTSSMRTDLLSSSHTVLGTGFDGGNTGQYKTYLTYVFGTLKAITGVTANPASPSVEVGKTTSVTLTIAPSGYNETFSAVSSDESIMTLTVTSNKVTVTGVAPGTANIIVTGVTSNEKKQISVKVGAAYATNGMSLTYPEGTLISKNLNSAASSGKLWLGTNDKIKLTATTDPVGASVTWSSSNTAIATVSSTGEVTAKAAGTATITAKTNKSSSADIKHTVTVNVVAATTVSPSSLTIDMDKDDTGNLKATMPSGADISASWKSNSTTIASVNTPAVTATTSETTVTGYVAGSTKIVLTLTRTGYVNSITKEINITVKGASDYATALTLSKDEVTLSPGKTSAITASTTPANISGSVTWSSNNTAVATVNSTGIITANTTGEAIITAQVQGKDGFLYAYVKVYVEYAPEKIEITNKVASAAVGQSVTFSTSITPSEASSSKVTWTTSNAGIATVNEDGKVDFIGEGVVTITAICGTVSDFVTISVSST